MTDLSEVKARLQAQLGELEARRAHIATGLAEPPDRDWDELAIEMEDDEALEGQTALIGREIASVKRALGRIQNGTYGRCVRCNEKIASERLEVRPEAALCMTCAMHE